jgi:hypothetical protein
MILLFNYCFIIHENIITINIIIWSIFLQNSFVIKLYKYIVGIYLFQTK